ncbi:MAG: helix-turn-helix domain-containing protein [Treponema sp.]|jgi:AraC-like DNA-binding protein/ligand-binding sensor protein|nr:helix-turn-helix domain-containing protein [Treponema sp.]
MAIDSIIQRREIAPLLFRAKEILRFFEDASGTEISIISKSAAPAFMPDVQGSFPFCGFCRDYDQKSPRDLKNGEYPCSGLHYNGINESRQKRGSYIYTCKMGFAFLACPFYSGNCYAGTVIAGPILVIERGQGVDDFFNLSGGALSKETLEEKISRIPERTYEQIEAMAQMLLFCASEISGLRDDNSSLGMKKNGGNGNGKKGESSAPGDENSGYSLDKERMLLASLRRGDNERGHKILQELLDRMLKENPGNFEYIQFRAIELVVLLSRAAFSTDSEDPQERDKALLEANNQYLQRIETSGSIEELKKNLYHIMESMSGRIFSFQGFRHASALRKAERFIWDNYTRKISLEEIATASELSAPYFSTIFKEEMGENFSTYLNRLRIERAAALLRETTMSLNDIAAGCSFEDQSWFSKIFKYYTGMSPGKYRKQGSSISSVERKTS